MMCWVSASRKPILLKEYLEVLWPDKFGRALLKPREFSGEVREVAFFEPLLIVASVSFVLCLVAVSSAHRWLRFLGISLPAGISLAISVLGMVAFLVHWFIWSGLVHLFAKHAFKGEGDFMNLLKAFGYSHGTFFLAVIGGLLILLSPVAFLPAWLLTVASLVWMLGQQLCYVTEFEKLDFDKAIMTLLFPIFIYLALACVLVSTAWVIL